MPVRYTSTTAGPRRGETVSFKTALARAAAPDGGLYVPETIPPLHLEELHAATFAARARAVLGAWLDDELGPAAVAAACDSAFDFSVPLVPLDAETYVLELFHGPTAAFKDFGARFLAQLLRRTRASGQRTTVLVATSGDTGAAVAHAFGEDEGTKVVLLYPAAGVSPHQEAFLLSGGANATALRVAGSFDDCQTMVRVACSDDALVRDLGLVPANSLNIGRLLPQIAYYVHAALELQVDSGVPLVVVPSGNLGNLTAGLLAKRGGAPIQRFLCAANRNDVFPRYLATGILQPHPPVRTPSNAMDVGAPSNAARIQALYGGRLDEIRRDVLGESVDDAETLRVIGDIWARHGRFVCPHTAVGLAARRRHPGLRPAIVLATAHPGKFAAVIRQATGQDVELPAPLVPAPRSRGDAVDMPARVEALRGFLHAMA
jgi:threonine synthase